MLTASIILFSHGFLLPSCPIHTHTVSILPMLSHSPTTSPHQPLGIDCIMRSICSDSCHRYSRNRSAAPGLLRQSHQGPDTLAAAFVVVLHSFSPHMGRTGTKVFPSPSIQGFLTPYLMLTVPSPRCPRSPRLSPQLPTPPMKSSCSSADSGHTSHT